MYVYAYHTPTWLDMKRAKRAEEKRPQIWSDVNFKCVPPQTGEDDDLDDVRDFMNTIIVAVVW